ncbi:MotA/TolQ/ExbB proton channel family protein [Aquimarina sp. 2201CG1-2-11]|uniref:MotA/TolQ/ExbB proton channel family protein n=1 Tax=Aquimarina discodermiae TaxID=3231043 RepID=UPI003461FB11
MISLVSLQLYNPLLFVSFYQLLFDGGAYYMFPILILLLLILFLILKTILKIKKRNFKLQKNISLINSIGLLAIVYGVIGQLIGLVSAFDKIELLGEISTSLLAGGLKLSALPTIFGLMVFIVSRISTVIFTWIHDHSETE